MSVTGHGDIKTCVRGLFLIFTQQQTNILKLALDCISTVHLRMSNAQSVVCYLRRKEDKSKYNMLDSFCCHTLQQCINKYQNDEAPIKVSEKV